jgi:hypothetical protein
MRKAEIAKLLAVAFEVCGGSGMSSAALDAMCRALERYDGDLIVAALNQCHTEVKGRLTLADIVSRIERQDGRPDAETAWAMIPKCSVDSCVWTDEMAAAWKMSQGCHSDIVGQRFAFREKYLELVRLARLEGRPARWSLRAGSDDQKRIRALQDAVAARRLEPGQARALAPHGDNGARKALPGPRTGNTGRTDCGPVDVKKLLREARNRPPRSLAESQARLNELVDAMEDGMGVPN